PQLAKVPERLANLLHRFRPEIATGDIGPDHERPVEIDLEVVPVAVLDVRLVDGDALVEAVAGEELGNRLDRLAVDLHRQFVPDAIGFVARGVDGYACSALAGHTFILVVSPTLRRAGVPTTVALRPITECSSTTPVMDAPSSTIESRTTASTIVA